MDLLDVRRGPTCPLPEVWPQMFDTEGFFLAAFRKAGRRGMAWFLSFKAFLEANLSTTFGWLTVVELPI